MYLLLQILSPNSIGSTEIIFLFQMLRILIFSFVLILEITFI